MNINDCIEMKYGCANDRSLSKDTEASSNEVGYDMTSSFNSISSNLPNLSFVDKAVHDIMESAYDENSTSDKCIMKFIINCLHEQILSLKEDLNYLKHESRVKNSTIDRLFDELYELRDKRRKHHQLSESSIDLDK